MMKNLLFRLTAILLLAGMTSTAFAQGESCDMAEMITPGTFMVDTIMSNEANSQPGSNGAVWYSFTPDTNSSLNVNSCLGGADTRVFLHKGTCDGLETIAANDDACELSEDDNAYASAIENFVVLAGTTYYVEWDNRWDANGFTWNMSLDELQGSDYDAAVSTGALTYTALPLNQTAEPYPLTANVGNVGLYELTNIVTTVNVYEAGAPTTSLFSASDTIASLGLTEAMVADFGTWIPEMSGNYTITYTVVADQMEEEADMANNTSNVGLDVQNTYAYDGPTTSTLGNPDSEIIQGQGYTFAADDEITSVTLKYAGDANATLMKVEIYSVVDSTGAPDQVLYSEDAPNAPGGWTTVQLTEPFAVTAGSKYFVALRSITTANVALGTDYAHFNPGNAWFYLEAIASEWTNLETFNADFAFAYSIRLNMGGETGSYPMTVAVDMNNETVDPAGVFLVGSFNGGTAPVLMTDNGGGIYSATVMTMGNSTVQYLFTNGTTGEAVPAECGVDVNGTYLRNVETFSFDLSVDPVCFSLCGACPIEQEACVNPDAIFCDNFNQYEAGDVSAQSDLWSPWPGGASGNVVLDAGIDGSSALRIVGDAGIDQLLLFPTDLSTGNYTTNWSLFIPEGKGAYFNIQGERENPGGVFRIECNFAPDNTGSLASANETISFDFPTGEWFEVTQYFDLNNDWAQIVINDVLVHTWQLSTVANNATASGMPQIGGVNFYPINADYDFYIDDIEMVAVPSCADMSIICDPFETYVLGDLGPQSPWWTTWPGGGEGTVVSGISNGSGNKALAITGEGSGGPQDVVLNLGDRTSGHYRFAMDIYTGVDSLAYYNIQEAEDLSSPQWNHDIFIDGNGNGRFNAGGSQVAEFTYNSGTWNTYEHIIDMDNKTSIFMVNGVEFYNGEYTGMQLGAINIFPINQTHHFIVDNVNFSELEPITPAPVEVTFHVETKFIEVATEGMFVMMDGTQMNMVNDGDDTWSLTTEISANSVVAYKFMNGTEEETVAGDCAVNGGRSLMTGVDALELDLVCYSFCVACDDTDVIDTEFDATIAVAPNPTTGVFNVVYNLENASDLDIRITNVLGQVVTQREVTSATQGTQTFDLSAMPAGFYSLVVTDGARLSTKRIIVE